MLCFSFKHTYLKVVSTILHQYLSFSNSIYMGATALLWEALSFAAAWNWAFGIFGWNTHRHTLHFFSFFFFNTQKRHRQLHSELGFNTIFFNRKAYLLVQFKQGRSCMHLSSCKGQTPSAGGGAAVRPPHRQGALPPRPPPSSLRSHTLLVNNRCACFDVSDPFFKKGVFNRCN